MDLFEIVKELNSLHGPSGDEGEVREAIAALARPLADEVSADTMGNLIVRKRGSGPRVMLSAHMDSVGFIVTHIEKEGFLRVGRLGGISPKETAFAPVRLKNGTRGVLAKEEKADFDKLKLDECYIDTGAADAEQAREAVRVGDTAVYDTATVRNGCKVISPYIDNRISCAILLKVLETMGQTDNDVYFVFSVQEEVGTRGAKTAAWAVDPDYALAVDVTDTDDTPGSERYGTVQLGKGPAIKVMDASVISHPAVVEELDRIAGALELPVQRDIMKMGGTDAGAICVSRTGVRAGGVSVPCRYVHTPREMADLNDAEGCVKLLAGFVSAPLEKL